MLCLWGVPVYILIFLESWKHRISRKVLTGLQMRACGLREPSPTAFKASPVHVVQCNPICRGPPWWCPPCAMCCACICGETPARVLTGMERATGALRSGRLHYSRYSRSYPPSHKYHAAGRASAPAGGRIESSVATKIIKRALRRCHQTVLAPVRDASSSLSTSR